MIVFKWSQAKTKKLKHAINHAYEKKIASFLLQKNFN